MLRFVRIWLPAIVTLAGVVVIVAGGFDEIALEGGAGIIGAGLAIWLMNVLFRFGLHDDQDRDAEDAARDYYDDHGRWPDDPTPPSATATEAVGSEHPTAPRRIPRTGTGPKRPPRRPS